MNSPATYGLHPGVSRPLRMPMPGCLSSAKHDSCQYGLGDSFNTNFSRHARRTSIDAEPKSPAFGQNAISIALTGPW